MVLLLVKMTFFSQKAKVTDRLYRPGPHSPCTHKINTRTAGTHVVFHRPGPPSSRKNRLTECCPEAQEQKFGTVLCWPSPPSTWHFYGQRDSSKLDFILSSRNHVLSPFEALFCTGSPRPNLWEPKLTFPL
ncbi:unnamed protein product [Cuscuta epithymum]|uniref:Uncharacterized protein n=1 Tax=Cuscuta epithymum TaxID=186058 RepID=A0AAV0G5U7_9ASTE|nr:unnamed protein product [Cuscuta epithymum]